MASPSDGPPLVPPEGRWSRRYEPAQRLGVGAFGEVWLARDTSLGEDVAIKVLRLSSSSDLARLRRETSALRVAQVPGVVRIRDDFRVDDRAFIVMDLVNGRPFGDGGPHAWAAVEPQVHALLATLARLHFAGLVHRDLKPTNILVDGRGNPIVLDLGVAAGRGVVAPRSPGGFEGTRYYAAPEQLDGLTVTARADMYALGAMLFEVLIGRASRELSGRLLSGGPSVAAVQAEEGVAAVPPAVARLMLALLAPSPDDRPDAVEALRMLGGSPPVVPASRVATLPARAGVDELRGLFHGPDVYLRLQEDAAAVLVARTGGRSDRVVAELDAWVRAGLATWEGDAARLDRASIGRLQAGAIVRVCGAPEVVGPDLDVVRAIRLLGPEATTARVAATLGVTSSAVLATLERLASRDMAWPLGGDRWGAEPVVERAIPAQERMAQVTGALSCLPSASDVRVALLVEVDAPWREIVDAVGARAEALVAEGRFHDCLARVELAASIARERGIGELPRPLVVAGTSAACFLAEPRAIERMRLVLEQDESPFAANVSRLLRCAWLQRSGVVAEVPEVLGQVEPFGDPNLDGLALLVAVLQSDASSVAAVERRLERDAPPIASVLRWSALGRIRYVQGRWREAAEAYTQAAALSSWGLGLANAAAAWLEAGQYDRAARAAQTYLETAVAARSARLEARAHYLLRAARYRSGVDPEVSAEHTRVAQLLDLYTGALHALVDAAVARRRGDREGCAASAAIAERCMRGADHGGALTLARGLASWAGAGTIDEALELVERAWLDSSPAIAAQVLGLIAARGDEAGARARGLLVSYMDRFGSDEIDLCREVMSLREALALAVGGPGGGAG